VDFYYCENLQRLVRFFVAFYYASDLCNKCTLDVFKGTRTDAGAYQAETSRLKKNSQDCD
jgi:hypothetical protein